MPVTEVTEALDLTAAYKEAVIKMLHQQAIMKDWSNKRKINSTEAPPTTDGINLKSMTKRTNVELLHIPK